jgi:hypothetical protein
VDSQRRLPPVTQLGMISLAFEVARWSLLAYVIIAGLIEYAFVRNHLSGGPLIVLTLSLVVFAVHVPMLMGFTVARFDEAEAPAEDDTRA